MCRQCERPVQTTQPLDCFARHCRLLWTFKWPSHKSLIAEFPQIDMCRWNDALHRWLAYASLALQGPVDACKLAHLVFIETCLENRREFVVIKPARRHAICSEVLSEPLLHSLSFNGALMFTVPCQSIRLNIRPALSSVALTTMTPNQLVDYVKRALVCQLSSSLISIDLCLAVQLPLLK